MSAQSKPLSMPLIQTKAAARHRPECQTRSIAATSSVNQKFPGDFMILKSHISLGTGTVRPTQTAREVSSSAVTNATEASQIEAPSQKRGDQPPKGHAQSACAVAHSPSPFRLTWWLFILSILFPKLGQVTIAGHPVLDEPASAAYELHDGYWVHHTVTDCNMGAFAGHNRDSDQVHRSAVRTFIVLLHFGTNSS
jgi:hypothetical protein